MELRDLRAFVACIDLGSMTQAAERVHVVQSAVSQAVSRLERSCGLPLLERRRDGVAPTEAGAALAVHARGILNAVERAQEDMEAFAGLEKGTIRLGILHTATPIVLTRLLRTMRVAHPGLRLHADEETAPQLAEDLSTGKLDMAVLLLPAGPGFEPHGGPTDPHGPAGSGGPGGPVGSGILRVVTLAPLDMVVVAGPGDTRLGGHGPARAGGEGTGEETVIDLAGLRQEEWVAFPPDNPGRQWLDRSCAQAGFTPRIAAEVSTPGQLKDFVAAGSGLGMVPAASVALERAAGLLECTAFAPAAPVTLGYAYRPPQPGRAPSALRRLLEDHFGRPPDHPGDRARPPTEPKGRPAERPRG